MQYGDEIDNDCDGEIDEERADGKGIKRFWFYNNSPFNNFLQNLDRAVYYNMNTLNIFIYTLHYKCLLIIKTPFFYQYKR